MISGLVSTSWLVEVLDEGWRPLAHQMWPSAIHTVRSLRRARLVPCMYNTVCALAYPKPSYSVHKRE